MKGDDISNRLLDLAIACLSIASQIDTAPAGRHIARQLIRCSTSNGANYEEARSAESIADFVHKIGVAAKEVRETIWWLRIIDRKRLAPGEEVSRWIDEARQLLAILIASARTARERANRERTPVPLAGAHRAQRFSLQLNSHLAIRDPVPVFCFSAGRARASKSSPALSPRARRRPPR